MNYYDQSNRRQHLRVQPERNNPIKVDINGEDFIEVLHAVDISIGGMGIAVSHMFEGCHIDKTVSVIVTLPTSGNRGFQVDCEIKHVENSIFGIQFVNLTAANRRQIKDYIASRLIDAPWPIRIKQRLGWV